MKVLITGASGIIGSSLADRIKYENEVTGTYCKSKPINRLGIAWERLDIGDQAEVTALCKKYSPDVVIHCAAVVHRKPGAIGAATYTRINSSATENLARAAALSNPSVHFALCLPCRCMAMRICLFRSQKNTRAILQTIMP